MRTARLQYDILSVLCYEFVIKSGPYIQCIRISLITIRLVYYAQSDVTRTYVIIIIIIIIF